MKNAVLACCLLFVFGCGSQSVDSSKEAVSESLLSENPAQKTEFKLRILQAEDVKEILKKACPELSFKTQSVEHLGVENHLYYGKMEKPSSRTVFNIGKRAEAGRPMTNLSISVSANKPMEADVKKEVKELIDSCVVGFLKAAFPDESDLINRCNLSLDSDTFGNPFRAETEHYLVTCYTHKKNGNPSYFSYVLKLDDNDYQEELNKRFIDQQSKTK